MTLLARAARNGKITAADILSAVVTSGDEARLALEAVPTVTLSGPQRRMISEAMWHARAQLEALEVALGLA